MPGDEVLEEAAVADLPYRAAGEAAPEEIINDNYDRVDRMTFDSLLFGPEMTERTREFAEKRELSRVPPEFRTGGGL